MRTLGDAPALAGQLAELSGIVKALEQMLPAIAHRLDACGIFVAANGRMTRGDRADAGVG